MLKENYKENLEKEIQFLKKISLNLFENINDWIEKLDKDITHPIFHLYKVILELTNNIFILIDKKNYFTAGTTVATLIEALANLLYVNESEEHLKDYIDFFYIDALNFCSNEEREKLLYELKSKNCGRFKKKEIIINDSNILDRKSYVEHFYKDKIGNLCEKLFKNLYKDNPKENPYFGRELYGEYRIFCAYKHISPFIIVNQNIVLQEIYNIIFISLYLAQKGVNKYSKNKLDMNDILKEYIETLDFYLDILNS